MDGGILFSMPGEKVFSTPGGNFLAIYRGLLLINFTVRVGA
jgi:hypothetical protein